MENYGEGKQVYIRKLIEEDYSTYKEVSYAFSLTKMYLRKSLCRRFEKKSMLRMVFLVLSLRNVQERYVDSANLKM